MSNMFWSIVFKTRDQKYRHKKNVICQPPTIPLSQLVNQHPFDTDTTEYIYLLQTRESLRYKETIYKVGRTCKEGLQRFKFYPKGSKLLLHIFCFDSVTVEKNILSQFNGKFKNASTYGKEYFDGDLTEMVSIVLKEVSSTFNCCFSMTRIWYFFIIIYILRHSPFPKIIFQFLYFLLPDHTQLEFMEYAF